MGAETKGCAKGLFPLFWGAIVIGVSTFGWVLYNKGALTFLVGGGPKADTVQTMAQPGMEMMPQPGTQNQAMVMPVGGMRWVGGVNPAPMQAKAGMAGVATGPSLFGHIIPKVNQIVVNISATAQLPVGHPKAQANLNALDPQGNGGANPTALNQLTGQNQNPGRPRLNEDQRKQLQRQQVGQKAQPPGNLAFVDPFSGPTVESIGSGAIVCPHGHILTNYHVIERATSVFVTTYVNGNRVRYPATVEKVDKQLDLAILKIAADQPLPFAVLADSDTVQIGDPVIAIGSPWGLSQTVTQGIVSAKRQTISIQGVRHANLLQTDASINRGNSGGPLINVNGEIVGVNTAIFTTNGAFSGVGFAIPSNTASEFLAAAGVKLPDPMMAQANAMNANADRRMGMNGMNGNMGQGGGMNMAGNMAMNNNMGQPVLFGFGKAPNILCNAQMPHPFWGDCAECHTFKDAPCAVNPMARFQSAQGRQAAFMNVTMMGRGANNNGGGMGGFSNFPAVPGNFGATNFVGMNVQAVNPIAARQFETEPNRGVLVRTVAMNSPAMKAKLLPGDIILKVDGRPVNKPKTFHKAIHKTKKGEPVRVFFMRKGVRKETQLTVGATPGSLNQVFPQPMMGMMGMGNNDDNRNMMMNNNMGMMGQNMAPMGQMGGMGTMMVNQDRRRGMRGNAGMGNNNIPSQNMMGQNMMGQNMAAMAPVNQDRRRGMQGNMGMGPNMMGGQNPVTVRNLNDTTWMGMDLNLMTPRKAIRRGLAPNTKGLRVQDVNNNSLAMMAGLQKGDIIKSINNIRIVDANSAAKALNAAMMNARNELEMQRFNMIGLVVIGP